MVGVPGPGMARLAMDAGVWFHTSHTYGDALKVLRARLYDQELTRQKEAIDKNRRTQVGSGERAEKIRTYNFPQNRVTDHRIGLTVHNLTGVLEGDLGDLTQALASHDRAERLKALS